VKVTQLDAHPVGSAGMKPAPRRGWSRDVMENRVFSVLRRLVIAALLLVTLFPFITW